MTWSITARCARTGQLGVAVSTRVPAVGSLCPFVQAGVGAISTQSFVNPYIGVKGLEILAEGRSAEQARDELTEFDPEPPLRQFSVVDANGGVAAYTGSECDGWAGHRIGQDYAVAGNMLRDEATIHASAQAFEESADKDLDERLIRALEAGQQAGGDKRGRQSAAVKIYSTEAYPLVDLRVDEHADPVVELRRIHTVAKVELFPFVAMLPTRRSPAGKFDFTASRDMGLLKDS